MEPLRAAIRWEGSPLLVEGEPLPLIPPGYVLLRTRYAAWSGVEEAVRGLLLPAPHGVVMGASGAGQPLEAAGVSTPQARLLAPVHVPPGWTPGVANDGWLSTYTAAPLEALEEAPASPLSSLSLYFSLACEAVEHAARRGAASLLVVGGGVTGFSAALLAAEKGLRVALYTGKKLRCPSGCSLYSTAPRLAFDAAYIASPSRWFVEAALAGARPWLVEVTPFTRRVSLLPSGLEKVQVRVVRGERGGCWRRLLHRWEEDVKGLVVAGDGLLVPPPLGGDAAAYILRL